MTETTTIAQGSERKDAISGKAACSYCCECGTYDSHTIICTCCGFDFRGEVTEADSE